MTQEPEPLETRTDGPSVPKGGRITAASTLATAAMLLCAGAFTFLLVRQGVLDWHERLLVPLGLLLLGSVASLQSGTVRDFVKLWGLLLGMVALLLVVHLGYGPILAAFAATCAVILGVIANRAASPLQEVGKALQKLQETVGASHPPRRIHLETVSEPAWKNPDLVGHCRETLARHGFVSAGAFRCSEIGGLLLQGFVHEAESLRAVVHELPPAGVFVEINCTLATGGGEMAWGNHRSGPVAEPRPGHTMVRLPEATTDELLQRAQEDLRGVARAPVSMQAFQAWFEQDYADGVDWVNSQGARPRQHALQSTEHSGEDGTGSGDDFIKSAVAAKAARDLHQSFLERWLALHPQHASSQERLVFVHDGLAPLDLAFAFANGCLMADVPRELSPREAYAALNQKRSPGKRHRKVGELALPLAADVWEGPLPWADIPVKTSRSAQAMGLAACLAVAALAVSWPCWPLTLACGAGVAGLTWLMLTESKLLSPVFHVMAFLILFTPVLDALLPATLVRPEQAQGVNLYGATWQGDWLGCGRNLQWMGNAVHRYRQEHQGQPPPNLSALVPAYLAAIPTCPAAGLDTYSAACEGDSASGRFTICCAGTHHRLVCLPENLPRYTLEEGLKMR